jgi:glycosyltransferase involved in cell wall biosynthesis
MHAGLVPLLTKECGIDTGDFGWLFENDNEEEIERLVLQVSKLSPDALKERALKTRQIATSQYSEDAFVQRWREIVFALQRVPVKDQTL